MSTEKDVGNLAKRVLSLEKQVLILQEKNKTLKSELDCLGNYAKQLEIDLESSDIVGGTD